MQNQLKDAFPSDTKKKPKDRMIMTLRSGRELKERESEKKKTKKEKRVEIREEISNTIQKLLKKRE